MLWQLDAEIAFTALALFNVLRMPLNLLPQVISSVVEANVSVKRLQKYLLSEQVDPFAIERKSSTVLLFPLLKRAEIYHVLFRSVRLSVAVGGKRARGPNGNSGQEEEREEQI